MSKLSHRKKPANIKTIMLGDPKVGKTKLCEFLSKERSLNSPSRTRRGGVYRKIYHLEDYIITLKVNDTAGQERYRSLTGSYYRGAHGGMIVYDVSQPSSFDSVTLWYKDLKEYSSNSERVSAMLVGTTSTSRNREVPMERAVTLAEHIGIPYMEVNIDTGENVHEAFEKLTRLVVENLERFPHALSAKHSSTTIVKQTQKSKSSFCAC